MEDVRYTKIVSSKKNQPFVGALPRRWVNQIRKHLSGPRGIVVGEVTGRYKRYRHRYTVLMARPKNSNLHRGRHRREEERTGFLVSSHESWDVETRVCDPPHSDSPLRHRRGVGTRSNEDFTDSQRSDIPSIECIEKRRVNDVGDVTEKRG